MRLLLLFLFVCPVLAAHAQHVELHVIDEGTRQPVAYVVGTAAGEAAGFQTDSLGIIRLSRPKGPYVLSRLGYNTRRIGALPDSGILVVALQPSAVGLREVEVLSPLARFNRERAFNKQFFRKELAGAKFKPGKKLYVNSGTPMGLMIGVEWSGVLSECALRASGKKGRYRRFARELRALEGRKISAIRYTTMLVSEQTGLDEPAAMAFIAANEISDEFLFQATDLELKMHIRQLYKERGIGR